MDLLTLRDMLIEDEGLRLKPYRDTKGKLTIGVGRNLDDVGITEAEAIEMLFNDLHRCLSEARKAFPWFEKKPANCRLVIVLMIFNMGLPRFKSFKRMIGAIEKNDFMLAAKEMLDSKWAREDVSPNRSNKYQQLMIGALL